MRRLTEDKIHASRIKLGNPYAYVSGDNGELDATFLEDETMLSADQFRRTEDCDQPYERSAIEKIAVNFQRTLWARRGSSSSERSDSLFDILDPAKAFEEMGYTFEDQCSLGASFTSDLAGYIDSESKHAAVSVQFPVAVRNFTAAHELGHALLHSARGMHRERPIDSQEFSVKKPRVEKEADYFASVFLMPKKLLVTEFVKRFDTNRFIVNDDSTYGLCGAIDSAARFKLGNRRALSLMLGSTNRYHTRNFVSLAELFKVSVPAMAIRLEELGLT